MTLSMAVKCSTAVLYNIENGSYIPNYLFLLRIAKALDIDVGELTVGDSIDSYDERYHKCKFNTYNIVRPI